MPFESYEMAATVALPYHWSLGMVILKEGKVVLIKNPEKRGKKWELPAETSWSSESHEQVAERGAREEAGLLIQPIKNIGSRITHFTRDGTRNEKTTTYWALKATGETTMSPTADEKNNIVRWFPFDQAINLLRKQRNGEANIVERARKFTTLT